MLIPRYTLRRLLLLMTLISVFCVIVAQAVGGKAWAISVSLSAASLTLCFLVYGALFGVAYLLASMLGVTRQSARVGTPFATTEPPIQMVPPEEPE